MDNKNMNMNMHNVSMSKMMVNQKMDNIHTNINIQKRLTK